MSRFEQEALGYGDLVIVSGTEASADGAYLALKAIEDTVIADMNFIGTTANGDVTVFAQDGTNPADTELNGKTIKAGDTWIISFKNISLTSGTVFLYKKMI